MADSSTEDIQAGDDIIAIDDPAPVQEPWLCCGRPTSKGQIITVGQLLICTGIITFAAVQMATVDNDRDQGIYLALMTSIFGYLAPSPISKK